MSTEKKHCGTKMDPTQSDRWWKAAIDKEEKIYVNNAKKGSGDKDVQLNSLGTAQEVTKKESPRAAQSHLSGAGALVRQAKAISLADVKVTSPREGGSPSDLKMKDYEAGSQAGSQAAKSTASYPRTPQFSQAGSKAGSSVEIMTRLSRLEKELSAERSRREAAEEEMKELLARAK